jgi:hypothetical protein
VANGTGPDEAPAAAAAAPEATDRDALRAALADMAVEVDMKAIEAAVKRSLRATLVELSAQQPPDDKETVADLIANRVAELIATSLMAAADSLQLQLEAFNDRIRASSHSLEALADELSARQRSASDMNDQLVKRLESRLDRINRRIDALASEVSQTRHDLGDIARE